jgi:hypothetical protein
MSVEDTSPPAIERYIQGTPVQSHANCAQLHSGSTILVGLVIGLIGIAAAVLIHRRRPITHPQ